MNWYPSTGWIPTLDLIWPSGILTTSLSLAAFSACVQLITLVLRASRERARTVSVPSQSFEFIEEQEVTKTAA